MKFTVEFSADTFKWHGSAKRVVGYIKKAGKMDAFAEVLKGYFGYSHIPSESEINKYVNDNQVSILHDLGMNPDGSPLKTNKIKVFLRLTAVVEQEVVSDDPEEAKDIAGELYWEESDPLLSMDRDEVQELVPVAYDMGDGVTRDYQEE